MKKAQRYNDFRNGRHYVSYLYTDSDISRKRLIKKKHSYQHLKIAGTTMDDGLIFNPRVHRYNIAYQYMHDLAHNHRTGKGISTQFLYSELEYLSREDVDDNVKEVLWKFYPLGWFKESFSHLLHSTYAYYNRKDKAAYFQNLEEIKSEYDKLCMNIEISDSYPKLFEVVKDLILPNYITQESELVRRIITAYQKAGRYFTLKYLSQFMKNHELYKQIQEVYENFDNTDEDKIDSVLLSVLQLSSMHRNRRIFEELR
jgi:uncharacterized protein YeeX (DUF496 family)